MRVGILTVARTNNNGTDLQAVAMQRIFASTGADAEIINYKCDKLENSRKMMPSISIKNLITFPLRFYKNISHNRFRRKYFTSSKKVYDKNNINEINYDRVVVGSDQIWNLDITGNDLNFFLPFATSNTKKYSYAASLGKTDITEWQEKHQLDKLLADFKCVSVREESGIEALETIGVFAKWDLDPLLMLPKENWLEHIKKGAPKKPFVLVYLVENNPKALSFAKKYANSIGAEVIMINQSIKGYKGIKSLRFCSVDKWIWLVKNASMVVTNSYHGISMSISFQTNFAVFPLIKNEQSNMRMLNLIKRFGIEKAVIENLDQTPPTPDWNLVEKRLCEFRNNSFEYIKDICL